MRRPGRTSLLITVPFALLMMADNVVISTHMYGDTSGTRRVEAIADTSLVDEIRGWTKEMGRRFHLEPIHHSTDSVTVARSNQFHDLGATEGVKANASDIVQNPLSFTTTYTWEETIKVDFLGNKREQELLDAVVFEYRLTMPGTIETANGAEIDGDNAVWKIKPTELDEDDQYTVSATATSLRWDVIVLLVYVGGYLLYRIIAFFVRRARLRPRKI